MRVLVCGDREWTSTRDKDLVFLILDLLKKSLQEDIVIIEGECRGVDTWAREWAKARQVSYLPFPADWKLGKRAGPLRNLKMLEEGKPNLVLAFHDDLTKSKGTKSMITLANKKDVPVKIYSEQDILALFE